MGCDVSDWVGMRNSSQYCKKHLSTFLITERCPLRNSHPLITDGKLISNDESSSNIDKQFISNHKQIIRGTDLVSTRKYVRKNRDSVYERFHNHGVRFDAVVDWDNVNGLIISINRFSVYKRLDFDNAIVKVFKRSILVTLRSSSEIVGKLVRDAELLSILMIKGVLDLLPKEIKVSNPEVVNVHNAFVNHPTAKYDVNVSVDGERRLISDNSKGLPEFEAINPKFAVSDSEKLENFNRDLIVNDPDLPSVQASKLNRIVDVLDRYATQMELHLVVEQKTSDTLDNINSGLNSLIGLKGGSVSNSPKYVRSNSFDGTTPLCISVYDSDVERVRKLKHNRLIRARALLKEYGWGEQVWS